MTRRPKAAAGAEGEDDFGTEAMRRRWTVAVGVISWLGAIIAPAVSFNVELGLNSDSGPEFQAFFLVLSAALFLLGWRAIDRLRVWMLGILALVSLALFITYSLKKNEWTCAYFPNIYDHRFTMGSELKLHAIQVLHDDPPADSSCQRLMEPWQGDAMQIWEKDGVVRRFLILFGLYAFAWLSLGLLVLGTARASLRSGSPS